MLQVLVEGEWLVDDRHPNLLTYFSVLLVSPLAQILVPLGKALRLKLLRMSFRLPSKLLLIRFSVKHKPGGVKSLMSTRSNFKILIMKWDSLLE